MDSQQLACGIEMLGPATHPVTNDVLSLCLSFSLMPILFAYPFSTCLQFQNNSEQEPPHYLPTHAAQYCYLLVVDPIPDKLGQAVSLPLLDV